MPDFDNWEKTLENLIPLVKGKLLARGLGYSNEEPKMNLDDSNLYLQLCEETKRRIRFFNEGRFQVRDISGINDVLIKTPRDLHLALEWVMWAVNQYESYRYARIHAELIMPIFRQLVKAM